MSVAASRLPAPLVASAPLPGPTPVEGEPAARPFAELLRQSRGAERSAVATAAAASAAADMATPLAATAPESAPAGDEGVPTSDVLPGGHAPWARANDVETTVRGTTRATDAAERSDPAPAPAPDPARIAERGEQDEERGPTDASTPAANPMLAVRPDAARPVAPELRFDTVAQRSGPAASVGRDADAGAASTAASTAAVEPGGLPDTTAARRSENVARADTARGAARAREGDPANPSAPFTQILADAQAADRPAAASAPLETSPLPATAIAAHEPRTPVRPDSDLAPPAATLDVPVDSPEFAAAFGVQVSVFVREGVQQAELHLNPAETGPVSIAISLEGSQAHVEFGADLAATRQAIENGLPALASALRDAGFTLAGGGVAQHARSGGGGHGGDDPAGRGRPDRRATRDGEAIAPASAVQRSNHRVNAGGIDLYA